MENSNVTVPFTGSLRIEKDITLNTWIYVSADASHWHRTVLNVQGNPNQHYSMFINTWDDNSNEQERGQFRAEFSAGGTGENTSIDCYNNGNYWDCARRPQRERWHMLTYTFKTVTEVDEITGVESESYLTQTYLDGVLYAERNVSDGWDNDLPAEGNAEIIFGGEKFKGVIDDFRIYDGALEIEEIKNIYALESTPSENFENSITVPAGQLNSNVYVFAVDDDLFDESDEKTVFAIDTVLNGEVNENSSSIEIEIEDNDIRPEISIELVERDTITENNDTTYSLIKVSLNQKTTKDVRFKLSANQSNDVDNAIDSDYIISEEKITNSTERNKAEMVAHYKFNGDASDATDNDHDGSVNGATLVEDRFGNAESAMYLTGSMIILEFHI